MAQHKAAESALLTAARALDRELAELAQRADHLLRAPLTTQRQLDRAREMLAGIAPAEQAVRSRLASLERAVEAADAARAEQSAAIAARAPHIDARTAELQRLLDLYISLGVRATEAQSRPFDAHVAATLEGLGQEASALLAAAREGDFPDIVGLAEALGRQIASKSRRT